MNAQKIAISSFLASLGCIVIVIITANGIHLYDEESTQHTEWILAQEQTENLSSIELLPPKYGNISINMIIENRNNIGVTHNDCRRKCNSDFDISRLESSIHDQHLQLNFAPVVYHDTYENITIRLPNRDWHINCFQKENSDFRCLTLNNAAKPVNINFVSEGWLDVQGVFNTFSIWQMGDGTLQFSDSKLNTVDIYGDRVDISLSDTNVNEIKVHSPAAGEFRADDFSLLERMKWQPLTEAEKRKIHDFQE